MKAGEGMTFVLRMITALVLMFSLTAALPAASVQADTVRVLPISGDIEGCARLKKTAIRPSSFLSTP